MNIPKPPIGKLVRIESGPGEFGVFYIYAKCWDSYYSTKSPLGQFDDKDVILLLEESDNNDNHWFKVVAGDIIGWVYSRSRRFDLVGENG